jgi:heterodisulfide reductase subunit A
VSESVASGLAAVTQSAAMLKLGRAELDPQVAIVDAGACTGCGDCVAACPFGAIALSNGTAVVDGAGCKGCGACTSICPESALDLLGYTDAQVRSMIEGMVEEVVA